MRILPAFSGVKKIAQTGEYKVLPVDLDQIMWKMR